MKKAVLVAVTLCFCPAAFAVSVITTHLEDPKAIYVDAAATNVDRSAALQAAIDKASGPGREGIVGLSPQAVTPSREPSICGRACGSLGMAPRDRCSCFQRIRRASRRVWE